MVGSVCAAVDRTAVNRVLVGLADFNGSMAKCFLSPLGVGHRHYRVLKTSMRQQCFELSAKGCESSTAGIAFTGEKC